MMFAILKRPQFSEKNARKGAPLRRESSANVGGAAHTFAKGAQAAAALHAVVVPFFTIS